MAGKEDRKKEVEEGKEKSRNVIEINGTRM